MEVSPDGDELWRLALQHSPVGMTLVALDGRLMGLGLNIVSSIVAANGGSVSLDSQVGRGSTFRVTLPDAIHRRSNREDS